MFYYKLHLVSFCISRSCQGDSRKKYRDLKILAKTPKQNIIK